MNPIVTAVVTVGGNARKSVTLEFPTHSGDGVRGPSNCYPTNQLMRQDSEWFFRRPRRDAATRSALPTSLLAVQTSSRRPAARMALGGFRSAWVTSHAGDTRRRCWSGRDPQLSSRQRAGRAPGSGFRPDRERGRLRRGWLLAHASESQVRLQVVAVRPAASTPATPAIATKEGSRCGRSRRRTIEGMEMRTFGESRYYARRPGSALLRRFRGYRGSRPPSAQGRGQPWQSARSAPAIGTIEVLPTRSRARRRRDEQS